VNSNVTYAHEFNVAIEIAQAAGSAVRKLYEDSSAETYTKPDGSPVTDADLASDGVIRAALAASFPDDAILTEEVADDRVRLESSRVWIVDPIDGTQQFVERTGEFDVLIALVAGGVPVVGVLLQPTTGVYLAASEGGGAWVGRGVSRRPFRLQPVHDGVAPRLLTSSWLNVPASLPGLAAAATRLRANPVEISPLGIVVRHFEPPHHRSDALIGLPTEIDQSMAWEWDFAAADIVIREAGGAFTDAWGRRFCYNKPVPKNIGGVILSVDERTHERVLKAIEPELPV
jgi:3'-phosphoadenosine 5'-phosphosulfate (PAPS) 3'-phosphatase